VNRQDLSGPDSWAAVYGKLPEIVAVPGTDRLDVALRSYDTPDRPRTLVLRFEDAGSGLALTRAMEAPSLGLLLGFAPTSDGGFFHATGSPDADVSATYPAVGQHRRNVVLVHRVAADGAVRYDVDLDHARALLAKDAEPIIHPGVASTARLAVAGNQVALVHGNNTAPDARIQNQRHQRALTDILDASTGEITDPEGIWCSHSFDQRYLVDGDDIYELHLGDAYPRQVVASRIRDGSAGRAFALFYPKGPTGENNPFTRLGNLARIDAGPQRGKYLLLVATERTAETANRVSGSRDLALVRTSVDFASGKPEDALDPGFGEAFAVASGGATRTNRVRWLTTYHQDAPGQDHAERPKLVGVVGGEFLVLWERWSIAGDRSRFEGSYAMRIDADGEALAPATRLEAGHLPRGDDAFPFRGQACWVTGDSEAGTLSLHCVAPDLGVTHVTLGPVWTPTPSATPPPTASAGTPVATGAPSGTPQPGTASPPGVRGDRGLEAEVVRLLNDARIGRGLGVLAPVEEVAAAARRHSLDMATHEFLDEVGSDYSSPAERLADAGYAAGAQAFVVARGPASAQDMADWLVADHGDRAFSAAFADIGVGYARNDDAFGVHYWSVYFASRR
jgi:uncharacterized protein YkwD